MLNHATRPQRDRLDWVDVIEKLVSRAVGIALGSLFLMIAARWLHHSWASFPPLGYWGSWASLWIAEELGEASRGFKTWRGDS